MKPLIHYFVGADHSGKCVVYNAEKEGVLAVLSNMTANEINNFFRPIKDAKLEFVPDALCYSRRYSHYSSVFRIVISSAL